MTRMRSADNKLARRVAFRLAVAVSLGVAAATLVIRISVPTFLALLYW